jgi:emericellamide synthase (highly reducing iterative type I polyketide synthase)
MTYQQWKSATLPKTDGSWNLHQVLPKSIDFFILMSSAVAVSGNPGQSNYAGACAYQDALAHYRHKQGLPAYSLNVGCVVNSGFVSENPEVAAALRRQGFGTITVAELLANLDYIVSTSHSRTGCQSSVGLIPTGNERGLRKGVWIDDAKFRHLRRNDGVKQESGGSGDVAESIVAAKTADDALQCICQAILQQLAKLFATSLKYLSEDRSLDDYGVDSLVAVELRNWIGAYLQANIPMLVLRKSGSIRELAGIVMKESRLVTIEA